MAIGSTDDHVAFNPGIGNLADDVSVSDTHNHPVFWGVVLVFVLDDQSLAGIVVSFALSPSAELNLVPLEISLVLHNFYKPHFSGFCPVEARTGESQRSRKDVLCRVHYYKVKDLILRKAWHRGPIDYDGASIQLLPDLSRATLGMRRAVRPLLAAIRESGATYTWGFPFHVQVKKENRQFILKSPDQLPELFLFLGSDPIPVPNWLDALLEDPAPQISNPLPQRRRRSRSSGAVSGQAHIHPSDPEL